MGISETSSSFNPEQTIQESITDTTPGIKEDLRSELMSGVSSKALEIGTNLNKQAILIDASDFDLSNKNDDINNIQKGEIVTLIDDSNLDLSNKNDGINNVQKGEIEILIDDFNLDLKEKNNGGELQLQIGENIVEVTEKLEPLMNSHVRMDIDKNTSYAELKNKKNQEIEEANQQWIDKKNPDYLKLVNENKLEIAKSGLEIVYGMADEVKDDFKKNVEDIGEKLNMEVKMRSDLKGKERATEKIMADMDGDAGKLLDAYGGTLIVKDLDKQHVSDIIEAVDKSETMEIVRIKDGYTQINDYGYADVKLNVQMDNGFIGEIIIIDKRMAAVKDNEGHKIYDVGRDLEIALQDEANPLQENEKELVENYLLSLKELSSAYYQGADTNDAYNKACENYQKLNDYEVSHRAGTDDKLQERYAFPNLSASQDESRSPQVQSVSNETSKCSNDAGISVPEKSNQSDNQDVISSTADERTVSSESALEENSNSKSLLRKLVVFNEVLKAELSKPTNPNSDTDGANTDKVDPPNIIIKKKLGEGGADGAATRSMYIGSTSNLDATNKEDKHEKLPDAPNDGNQIHITHHRNWVINNLLINKNQKNR